VFEVVEELAQQLRAGLADYLALRRALGYRLARPQ
jgi:hypothetical protein